jgi:hypothetical protein
VRNNYEKLVPDAERVFDHSYERCIEVKSQPKPKPKSRTIKPLQSVEQVFTPEKEIVQVMETDSQYRRKYDYFLSAIVEKALMTKTTLEAQNFANNLWPDHPTRELGVKVGRQLCVDPREAAILTALTSGKIHQRKNTGASDPNINMANEMHLVIANFLSDDESRLNANDLQRRFYDIFLADF